LRRAIVTGARGFLGRHLVRDLLQQGVRVTTLSRQPGPQAEPTSVAMGDAPWSATRLARIIEAAVPDVVFHLVGGVIGSSAELEQLNVEVASSIMQALRIAQVHPLLVCCGSAAEYGAAVVDGVPVPETASCAPVTPYGAAKLALTKAALAFGEATATPVLVARIFNPIGPGMPSHLALGEFARQIAIMPGPHGVLQAGNLQVFRDFVDIEHVATALGRLAENPDARGIVNICSGRPTELNTLLDILIGVSGKSVTITTNPARLRPGELQIIIGSTARLASLGAEPPPTDYADVVGRVWRDAEQRWASP
jgi:GDP-4-dehydro-6-deoxy-D-mannose reductase